MKSPEVLLAPHAGLGGFAKDDKINVRAGRRKQTTTPSCLSSLEGVFWVKESHIPEEKQTIPTAEDSRQGTKETDSHVT